MDFLRPQPVVDLETGEGQEDPRARALAKFLAENQPDGQVLDPQTMMQMKKGPPELPDEFVPRTPYAPPQVMMQQEGQGASAGNENPMANVPMLRRKPYEGPQRTPDELQQLYDQVDKRALAPEDYQERQMRENPSEGRDELDDFTDKNDPRRQAMMEILNHIRGTNNFADFIGGKPGLGGDPQTTQEQAIEEYLQTLPERAVDRFRNVQEGRDRYPATDSEIDAAYGKGATEREMLGYEPYDTGFTKPAPGDEAAFPRRRRPNMPPSERFQADTYGSGEFIEDRRN